MSVTESARPFRVPQKASMGIYVETTIRGSMDELWRRTQTPELHAERARAAGAREFFGKPIEMDLLLAAVGDVLGG